MKKSIIDKYLSTTGYLPPRNEDEMVAFEKVYSSVTMKKGFPIDVSRIVNGGDKVVKKTFISMMEALGYDVELTYMKREKTEDK